MMQNSDLSWLLPFDKTKKLNLERIVLSFKKHEDSPVASITVLFSNESNGIAWQWFPILPGQEITGKVYGCFEKRNIGPDEISR